MARLALGCIEAQQFPLPQRIFSVHAKQVHRRYQSSTPSTRFLRRELSRIRNHTSPGRSPRPRRSRSSGRRANRRQGACRPIATPARSARCRKPAGSGFRGNGPSPPMIASCSKYCARSRPSRISRVAPSGLLVSTASGTALAQEREDLRNPWIGARVHEQPCRRRSPGTCRARRPAARTPAAANARATSVAAPSPTIRPIASSERRGAPDSSSTRFAASARSRRESTSVPSRSKTTRSARRGAAARFVSCRTPQTTWASPTPSRGRPEVPARWRSRK